MRLLTNGRNRTDCKDTKQLLSVFPTLKERNFVCAPDDLLPDESSSHWWRSQPMARTTETTFSSLQYDCML